MKVLQLFVVIIVMIKWHAIGKASTWELYCDSKLNGVSNLPIVYVTPIAQNSGTILGISSLHYLLLMLHEAINR